jgi:hypothetical protein
MQEGLKQFTVKAPKAGMVIYKRNWDGSKLGVGGMINAWDNVVAELPDLREMISKTYVNEIDISKVKVGQTVKIGIDAFPEKKFTGQVIEVANIGEQLQNSNAKVYEVRIIVNEFDSILRPAMTTKNTIETNIIDKVLFTPIESIYNSDSTTFVYKKDGGSVIRQQVVVGESNENEIIIREGLNEKDEVLLVPPDKSDKLKMVMLDKKLLEKYKPKQNKQQARPKADTAKKITGKEIPAAIIKN